MKSIGDALSSRCASRVSSLPFVSSSPIDSSQCAATRSRDHAGVHAPHDRELHADAAAGTPRSRRRRAAWPAAAPRGNRRRQRRTIDAGASCRSAPCAAITVAPVCPALNSATPRRAPPGPAATLIVAVRLAPQRGGRRLRHVHDLSAASTTRTRSTSLIGMSGRARFDDAACGRRA